MENCPKHSETLWLDVHGELEAEALRAWQEHLRKCPACREERNRLALLLEETRETLTPDDLSPREASELSRTILGRLGQDRGRRARIMGLLPPRLPRPAYALGAACLAALAFGWIWSGPGREPLPLRTTINIEVEESSRIGDTEIFQNLGLLEELEVIEKVVAVVDRREISM